MAAGISLFGVLLFALAIAAGVLLLIFVLVPLFKGIGYLIGYLFGGIGWLFRHVFGFIGGMLTDTVRFVGALIAIVALIPLGLVSIIVGRWSAAGHYRRAITRECSVAGTCVYRVALQRPLRFLLLGGLLEGLEQRVDEAVQAAPTADLPRRRTGNFDGYTIVGSLPSGGSGAKLYIAEPDDTSRRNLPDRVVIKSFALTDGSTLPQIVRESRALEAAKQLGLVLDHGMDEHRFFYVMPYHQGDHLGVVTRQLHGQSDTQGLHPRHLAVVFGFVEDLLRTLRRYHRGGLWHKDVKPENVIVHDGRAHLVDLGLVTPLRSAMTLTTHGTEYFRDPEMVRMALRGVKVHQVDGAKFDVYAAGAVLYFVTENTFPAHGGLSAFSKRSPEAVRWIIRRAMADYNKRYETADQMLADIEHVSGANDPFKVKAAELPSVRGEGEMAAADFEAEQADEPQPQVVASAGSPKPPGGEDKSNKTWGVYVGLGGARQAMADYKAGRFTGDDEGEGVGVGEQPVSPTTAGRRPKLRVINWWTGAYQVQDPGTAQGGHVKGEQEAFRQQARAFRRQASAFRGQAEALRRQVSARTITARRAAREQVKAARTRAREMRYRARAHRHQTTRSRQPSAVLGFVAIAVLLGCALLVWPVASHRGTSVTAERFARGPLAIPSPRSKKADHLWPLLLVNDHPAATNPLVQAEVDRIIQGHRDQGWIVVIDDKDAEVAVRKYLPAGVADSLEPMPLLLRNALLEHKLGGILQIASTPGDGEPHERFITRLAIAPSTAIQPQPDGQTIYAADEDDTDHEDD